MVDNSRMERSRLAGKVVVVPAGWPEADAIARRLAADGATVVIVGGGEAAGRLAAEIEAAGVGRAAVFAATSASAADVDSLADFLAELFRPPAPPAPPAQVGPAHGPEDQDGEAEG